MREYVSTVSNTEAEYLKEQITETMANFAKLNLNDPDYESLRKKALSIVEDSIEKLQYKIVDDDKYPFNLYRSLHIGSYDLKRLNYNDILNAVTNAHRIAIKEKALTLMDDAIIHTYYINDNGLKETASILSISVAKVIQHIGRISMVLGPLVYNELHKEDTNNEAD